MVGILSRRMWKFGDDIDKGLMIPVIALDKVEEKRLKYCCSSNRLDWVDLVRKGIFGKVRVV